MVKLIGNVKQQIEEDRIAKELAEKTIHGEDLENQDDAVSEEEPLIDDDVVSASHSPSEDEDIRAPEKPVLPPYNYKELKTIHYAKFFTSCIFTPEQ